MTDGHRALMGSAGDDLTGIESRTLRAALNLERRHVVALANALGVEGDRGPITVERLTGWERSKGRGYPPALVEALGALEAAAEAWGASDASTAKAEAAPGAGGPVATLRRPLGGRRVLALLRLPDHGLRLSAAALEALSRPGDDFWQVMADAATVRAAQALRRAGVGVRIVMDRDPD